MKDSFAIEKISSQHDNFILENNPALAAMSTDRATCNFWLDINVTD